MFKKNCRLHALLRIAELLICLVVMSFATFTYGQVSIEEVDLQLNKIKSDERITKEKKTVLEGQLESLKIKIGKLEVTNNQEKEFRNSVSKLEKETKELKTDFINLQSKLDNQVFVPNPKASIEMIAIELSDLKTQRGLVESELGVLNSQVKSEKARPDALKKILNELVVSNMEISSIPGEVAGEKEQSKLGVWQDEVNRLLAISTKKSAVAELTSSPTKLEWLQAKLSLKQITIDYLSAKINNLENQLDVLRSKEAESFREQSKETEANLSGQHPMLKGFAARNTLLSNLLHDMTDKLGLVKEISSKLAVDNQKMGEDFNSTQHKIEVAGLSHALGQVLLEESRRLSTIDFSVWEKLVEEEEMADIGITQIQHEEEIRKVRNKEEHFKELVKDLSDEEINVVKTDLIKLVDNRSILLSKLIELEKNYLRTLGDLDYITRQFKAQVQKYEKLISEKLLWIKSSPGISVKMLGSSFHQAYEIASLENIKRLIDDLIFIGLGNMPGAVLVFLIIIAFSIKRAQLIELLTATSLPLKRLTSDAYKYTIKALIFSIILGSPVGVIFIICGYVLSQEGLGVLANILSEAFIITGGALYFILIIRQLCRENGLLSSHFKWTEGKVKKTNVLMGRLCYTYCPMLFLSVMVIGYDFGSNHGALPHLIFISSMIMLSFCILSTGIAKKPVSAKKFLSYCFIVAPLILAGLATFGYVYTANTLCLRLVDTFSYLVSLLLVHQLTMRWLLLAHRKLKYQSVLEKRAAQKNKSDESHGEYIEEPTIDLAAVSKGGKELLNTALVVGGAIGLWIIWAEIMPAFNAFDESALWHQSEIKNGQEVQIPVTLFDIGLALFITAVTVLAAKRLPTLLEFILLPYFKLSAGSLYTVRTLTGYVIVATGIISALNTVGASWSQLQWLVAALSVGIGFGLQEIVANFISGLIILFERPIRVGDIVTIGGTDGVVTRIQIRATTIKNWDSKELLVPNKEFITQQLLNWTLSDQTTRIVTSVGVAYGTDIVRAMNIVLNTAKNHPNVIDTPEPSIIFESMGDNSLNIKLRSYVAKIEHRPATASELNISIYNALNEAGMAIPYPQRDIHLKTSSPIEVCMKSSEIKET